MREFWSPNCIFYKSYIPVLNLHIAGIFFLVEFETVTCEYTLCDIDLDTLCSSLSQVNGFYGARGVMGNIPDAYTYIASSFYHLVKYYNMQCRIRLYEYYRSQWTYHVKGLWYYLPNQNRPFLSMMGSSTFGKNSPPPKKKTNRKIKNIKRISYWC